MNFVLATSVTAAGLFVGMLLMFEVGRRVGVRRLARDPEGLAHGAGPVEAAVFGLLGLLLAFAFSGAGSRFETRRQLVAEEANTIGTAYLRIDLLASDAQPQMRALLRRYLDTRLQAHTDLGDAQAAQRELARTAALQAEIWAIAVPAVRRADSAASAPMLLLPALNQMFDITTTRDVASRTHPPPVIYVLLASLCLVCALLVGYVMCRTATRSWFYKLIIATTMTITFYVILDLEYPRLGLIRVDAVDQTLMDLRASMR